MIYIFLTAFLLFIIFLFKKSQNKNSNSTLSNNLKDNLSASHNFVPIKIIDNDNELEKIVTDFSQRKQIATDELTASLGKALPNDVLWRILQNLYSEFFLKDHKIIVNVEYQRGLLLQKEKKYKQAISHYANGLYYLMNFYDSPLNPTAHIIDFVTSESQLIEMAQHKFINKIQLCIKYENLDLEEVKDLSLHLVNRSPLPNLTSEQFIIKMQSHLKISNKTVYEDISTGSKENNLVSELAKKYANSQWHKTTNDSEAEEHTVNFWDRHRKELEMGEFWADRIHRLKNEPVKRLSLALENLPLPASFREGAIAIRSLIKEKRKVKENYEEELALLYWLAAINSFSIPYSEVLKEPGYNVIEAIPGEKLKTLQFSYKNLGYKALELLNKTDIKWLIEAWGEPEFHSTLHEMYIDLWREYENKLLATRQRSKFY